MGDSSRTPAPGEPRTLRELLLAIRDGFALHRPILVEVGTSEEAAADNTFERTMTLTQPMDWMEAHGLEYATSAFFRVGPNTLHVAGEPPVMVGRSRRCDVRVDNESVSKVHASLHFDHGRGEYLVVDEASRNGSSINGTPLVAGERTAVWPGAYLCFGDAVFVFLDAPTLRKLARLV
ncbi:MAG: FHA domain-containing protein [Kofleriaceae bacterium]|jgi:hypothetical protein|nr:FHA domain-containing protein [Kofleriaceae bacterium]MBP6841155.1 FHA domain-containing protein [Kofleriaceae bacterium]MBP9205574.1 FHA domain-containing protein [Kofleriaceae bacterium]